MLGFVRRMRGRRSYRIWVGLAATRACAYQWWRDVSREASYQGWHTLKVQSSIRWGIVLFITTEVIFFLSFFWAYLNRRLAGGLESGFVWPPRGITGFNPIGVPLLNTGVLLRSGVSVTWAHHALVEKEIREALIGLALTIYLGFLFTALQVYEYRSRRFTLSDSVYGSVFFVATGFHGLHVTIGAIALIVGIRRVWMGHLSSRHHVGLEATIWYWHFVDVVWVTLFVLIYWWGRLSYV